MKHSTNKKKITKKQKPTNWAQAVKKSMVQEKIKDAQRVLSLIKELHYLTHIKYK